MEGPPERDVVLPSTATCDNDAWKLVQPERRLRKIRKTKELKALFIVQANKYRLYPFVGWENVYKKFTPAKK